MLYPDHQTLGLLVREHQATLREAARRVDAVPGETRTGTRRVRSAGAIAVLAVITAVSGAAVPGNAAPSLPRADPFTARTTLPGDSPVPSWPYETGALVGTSETYVDVRADGSYFDLGIGRRVSVAR
jgi:hypothetical protein